MSCEDLCSMNERCHYWTSYGQGIHCCHFFSSDGLPRVSLQEVGLEETKRIRPPRCDRMVSLSGYRKNESFSAHLGGIVHVPPQRKKPFKVSRAQCRQQAHVANSPMQIEVSTVALHHYSTYEKDRLCSSTEALTEGAGKWVGFDTTVCYRNASSEANAMALQPTILLKAETINGVAYKMLKHIKSNSILYASKTRGHTVYSFRAPRNWFAEQSITPPWQLHPRCTLGHVPIPPETMDMKGVFTKVISFSYVHSALTGYEYISPAKCRFKYLSRGNVRSCFSNISLASIIVSGDSVIGGFSSVFKWIIGVNAQTNKNWYDASHKHLVTLSSLALSQSKFTFGGLRCHLKSYKKCLEDIMLIPHENKSLVIINWHLQHLIWGQTFARAETWANRFYKLFKKARNAGRISTNHTFIFFNGMALHGFREPYCTQDRSRRFSNMIGNEARSAGWMVLDAFNMTLLRTDMSNDGMHYNDAMNFMFCQMILNMLCG